MIDTMLTPKFSRLTKSVDPAHTQATAYGPPVSRRRTSPASSAPTAPSPLPPQPPLLPLPLPSEPPPSPPRASSTPLAPTGAPNRRLLLLLLLLALLRCVFRTASLAQVHPLCSLVPSPRPLPLAIRMLAPRAPDMLLRLSVSMLPSPADSPRTQLRRPRAMHPVVPAPASRPTAAAATTHLPTVSTLADRVCRCLLDCRLASRLLLVPLGLLQVPLVMDVVTAVAAAMLTLHLRADACPAMTAAAAAVTTAFSSCATTAATPLGSAPSPAPATTTAAATATASAVAAAVAFSVPLEHVSLTAATAFAVTAASATSAALLLHAGGLPLQPLLAHVAEPALTALAAGAAIVVVAHPPAILLVVASVAACATASATAVAGLSHPLMALAAPIMTAFNSGLARMLAGASDALVSAAHPLAAAATATAAAALSIITVAADGR